MFETEKGAMMKISMLLPVYNEEEFLTYSLATTIDYVDEVIIVDGGPFGPSDDKTHEIISGFDKIYPNKIKYFSGTFRFDNGGWDESASRNLGLSNVTGDFLMPHCGDMIYTHDGMARMVDAVNRYPDKKIIYCLFAEFWKDERYIRLYRGNAMEAWYPVMAISDMPIVSMDIIDKYIDGPHLHLNRSLVPGSQESNDAFLYVPNVYRYHYGWISGFDKQVEKHIRNMTMGAWASNPEMDIRDKGDMEIAKWAINHVIGYKGEQCYFDYCGEIPLRKRFSYLDRHDETIAKYEALYGEGFWINE